MVKQATNMWYSKPNLGLKGLVMSFLYLFLLILLGFFLVTCVAEAQLDHSYGSSFFKNISIAFSRFFGGLISDPGTSIFMLLGMPIILSLMIHQSFLKSMLALIGFLIIFSGLSNEGEYTSYAIIILFIPGLFISLAGLVMRAYYNVKSMPIRLSILIVPQLFLLLKIFISLL